MHGTEFGCVLGGRNVRFGGNGRTWDRKGDGPGMKFEVVVERDRFFARLGDKIDPDLDFELAPAVGRSQRQRACRHTRNDKETCPVSETSNGGLSMSVSRSHQPRHMTRERERTSRRVGVRFVELERDAFDKVSQVVCTTDSVRIWRARSPSDGDRPSMGMALWRELLLGGSQHCRCVPIYDRSMDRYAL